MTDQIHSLKDGAVKHGGYAYFSGTGPTGKKCAGCENFIANRTGANGRCTKWMELRGRLYDPERDAKNQSPPMCGYAAACKYWVEAEKQE